MAAAAGPGPMPDPNEFFGQPIIPVGVVTIALSTLFVGMRFWSRTVILRVTALEDWFILIGWVRHPKPNGLLGACSLLTL